ncbi:hypothetical protein CIPAW_02G098200 [Carya illinoinensis]|uniref:Uncharacterized protein n=1 Tax=Carya illinoinensis TaxID=32201 RepID=A0A8T1RD10_CARIL|nr:hypothetical protein CIPAW_02G098200 [Carya illinoinensis]
MQSCNNANHFLAYYEEPTIFLISEEKRRSFRQLLLKEMGHLLTVVKIE